MPVIIAATDFSDIGNNAVHYACNMAMAYNASVTIVHSYLIPVSFTDNPMPVMPIEEGQRIATESMNELAEKLGQTYPQLSINSHITFGDITDSLQEYTENTNPWMIVVGNSTNENDTLWLGSNLINELRNLPYSVMAISPGTTFKPANKICLACDFKNIAHHLPADTLIDIVQNTKAALHVLNVDHDNKDFGTEAPLQSTALHELLIPADPHYHYIDNADIEEGIKNFIEENNIDWLVVTPHKHPFFEGLFHKSHTKAIVKRIHVPIIALHEKA
jgi:nucleotide-binding universal stress UspA family protein